MAQPTSSAEQEGQPSFLERPVPLWLVLFIVLLGGLFTLAFGWAVLQSARGNEKTGMIGDGAVIVANFPSTVKAVFTQIISDLTGAEEDVGFRTPREFGIAGFKPIATASGIEIEGLMMRADATQVTHGWRILAGALTIDGVVDNAAVLLSPELEVVKTWHLTETAVGGQKPRAKARRFVHGIAYLPDGSLIFTFDGAISLQRIGPCGQHIWATGGNFNHSVTLDNSGTAVWTLIEQDLAKVSVDNGKILRLISMEDIIAANPEIDILELRRLHANGEDTNERNTKGEWLEDSFHLNDVEPLPIALAGAFPQFTPGDLLVSARELNLLFVIDQETLRVKWWRVGDTQRQHDPDWEPNGKISVLNNRMSRDYSEIVDIDPRTYERTVRLDGRDFDFYTRIRGEQQRLPDGHLVVTSTRQGRAFEIDSNGHVVLDILNVKPGSDTISYMLSDLIWLPPDAIGPAEATCAN